MSFDFGFGHLEDGFKKGFQYEQDAWKMMIKAIQSGNVTEINDLVRIAQTHVVELAGVIANPLSALGDPFSNSRHMLQAAENTYGKTVT